MTNTMPSQSAPVPALARTYVLIVEISRWQFKNTLHRRAVTVKYRVSYPGKYLRYQRSGRVLHPAPDLSSIATYSSVLRSIFCDPSASVTNTFSALFTYTAALEKVPVIL